jgi:threonine dehydrogenase-like Zn-dependent dehydrogenase
MKTIVLEAPGSFVLREAPAPEPPAPGQALVRVRQVGICGSDLHAYRGSQTFFTYPRIVGHELAVEVLAVGETEQPPPVAIGDRSAVEPYLNCGECIACRRARGNCCVNMQVLGVHLDGGLQEFISVPLTKLHPANTLSLDALTLVEPLCIGAHAVRRAGVAPGEWALVIGAGPIGQAVATFARLAGARIMVMEISDRRLAFCRERLGLSHIVDAKGDALAQLQAITGGDLPTLVFDATGSPRSMMSAFQWVAHSGTLVFVGHNPSDITFSDPLFHAREMTVLGSRNALPEDFHQVIASLEAGAFDPAAWISERAAPEELAARFPRWLEPESGVIKPVVMMG